MTTRHKGDHKVEKIGGTSMAATAALLDNVLVAGRTGPDRYNRIFVVSAYAGMTDLLLENKRTGEPGVYGRFVTDDEGVDAWRPAMDRVRRAMHERNAGMFAQAASVAKADGFIDQRLDAVDACLSDLARLRSHGRFCVKEQLVTARELLAALGEQHSAHATSLLLRERGVDATFIDLTVWNDGAPRTLDEQIEHALAGVDLTATLPIVTGYAACTGGMVQRFARGYTEMTFSRVAVLTGAREAVIHKEFHLSSADPKLVGVDKARKIGRTNYDVADQLANLGMEAIHPGAGRGLRQSRIPLRVRNTFDREDEGTLVCGEYVSDMPRVEIITGIRQLQALQFFEQDMVGVKGYDAAILDALTHAGAWIVSKSSNANTITHYLSASAQLVKKVIADLQARYPEAAISAHPVAMVAAIGSDISRPGLVPKALRALDEAGIPMIAIQHQIRNVDIQFIVECGDYDGAVRVLHHSLIEIEQEVAGIGETEDRRAA